jgi:hypothetical protein
MSASVGAFAVTDPVAAHMPGGGDASMAFMLTVRMRPVTEVVEALVDVRDRFVPGVVGVAPVGGGVVCEASGRGNGTGVGIS